jgi:hypothetical protein
MLGRIWQFLKDPANLGVLGSIGGAIVAIAGGAWAVFVYLHPAPEAKSPPAGKQIEADCGSVAIGGDVTGATITAGSSGDCPKPKP